jgi:hypothetical protein
MQAIMEDINGNGHLVVAIPGQPEDRFEVTEVIRQGPSLVPHCQPVGPGNAPGPSSHQDQTDRVFLTDDEPASRSFHDPPRSLGPSLGGAAVCVSGQLGSTLPGRCLWLWKPLVLQGPWGIPSPRNPLCHGGAG